MLLLRTPPLAPSLPRSRSPRQPRRRAPVPPETACDAAPPGPTCWDTAIVAVRVKGRARAT
eukprot:CAMPEP_0196743384 /NCGR_PEP_ID=MMETSP1091-20130531/52456_1 /TAXON_ID=302021 /ORGANISM="Rhodomonas sp., Strain CCMP768" /LENGTH=60 /DNA_ID=CAMNT_0042089727 /DNA_START=32 /DNA_END=214 /DNA_ORIENTATION=+